MKQNKSKKAVVGSRSPVVIHVITGDGKGKTTASLGLALRALGAGKKVKMIQFMKKPIYSEHKAIKKYQLPIEIEAYGIGFYKIMGDKHTDLEHQKACQKGLEGAQQAIKSNQYDLIILDEINVALSCKLIDIDRVISILRSTVSGQRSTDLDIVLTGRGAPQKLKNFADLVSEVKNIKNYYDIGIKARKGIEF